MRRQKLSTTEGFTGHFFKSILRRPVIQYLQFFMFVKKRVEQALLWD